MQLTIHILIIGSHVYETISNSPSRPKTTTAQPTILEAQTKKGATSSVVHTKDTAVQQTVPATSKESVEAEPEKKKRRFTLRKKN